jgi:hypothetical protein
MIKSILVPLSTPEMAEPSLVAAIGVASVSDAHIDVLHVRPMAAWPWRSIWRRCRLPRLRK